MIFRIYRHLTLTDFTFYCIVRESQQKTKWWKQQPQQQHKEK